MYNDYNNNNDFENNNTQNDLNASNDYNVSNINENTNTNSYDYNQNNDNNNLNSYNATGNNDAYQYPSFEPLDSNSTVEEPDEGNKKSKIFVVLLIIIILGILASIGVLVYKLISSKSTTITDIDSIVVEGGTINEKFDKNTDTYTIESRNDSIKLICKYKNKEVNISECNKSILINKNEIKNIVISLKNKKYTFIVARIGNDAPIINDVTGIPTDWVKETVVKVDTTFQNEMADSAYSFDAGATWQKEDSITVDTNRTLYIVTKDINNNISAIYTAKLDKVDNEGPEIKVQSVDKDNGVITIDIKDPLSGITNIIVTESADLPTKWDAVELTNDTVIKYNATSTKVYYVWAKDKVGNISFQAFSLDEDVVGTNDNSNSSNNNNQNTQNNTQNNKQNNNKQNNNNQNNNNQNNNNQNNNNQNNTQNNNQKPSQEPAPTKPPVEHESITISGVAGNTSEWTKSVTLKVSAKSTVKGAKLNYSFDGGKSYQSSNSKTFSSNTNVKVVVKNTNTGVVSEVKQVSIKNIDNTKPKCDEIIGASTTWTKDARTIKVVCSDNESGCSSSTFTKTFNTTMATSTITISDKVGNTNTCKVNVYIDTKGPTIKYNLIKTKDKKGKESVESIEFTITDNESGLNLDTIKYKQRILKKVPDLTWSKRNRFDSEDILREGHSYKYTKKVGLNKYFTVTATDNLGNVTEIEVPIE